MFAVSQRESGAKCFSYATAQHTQLSSVVQQEKPNRGAPPVLIKTRLGSHMASEKQTWSRLEAKQQSKGLPASFQLLLKDSSCYRPGASSVWIYWAQKQRCLPLPSLTSINSPKTPSELPFSICVSFSPTDDLAVAQWLTGHSVACESNPFSSSRYCIQRTQWPSSPSSHLSSQPSLCPYS